MIRQFLISLVLTIVVSSIAQAEVPPVSRPSPPIRVAAVAPALPPIQFDPPSIAATAYVMPAEGVLSSGYGMRWGRMHRGIDIAGPIGTPVVAAASGMVEFAGWNSGGYGNVIDIRHRDGSLTRYAHLSQVQVQQGDCVSQGQVIGEIGSTGRSTGPHLHFEMHLVGKGAVNPVGYLPKL
jgi:murein DD-endopeptidase MepM/ murein hydrolase activator NlpD